MKQRIMLVGLIGSAISASALADSLNRATVEKKLHDDFKGANQIQVTSMKENYWGLYRNYQVSFSAQMQDAIYRVSCRVDQRPSGLSLNDCTATDRKGASVDVAKFLQTSDDRVPASR